MECPYCGAELELEDSYGTKEYIIYGDEKYKSGDIYRCPNAEGFDKIEDAIQYILNYYGESNADFERSKILRDKYFEEFGINDLTEVCCESNCSNVCGSFYTTKSDELIMGYPC